MFNMASYGDTIDVVMVPLLLALNIFNTLL